MTKLIFTEAEIWHNLPPEFVDTGEIDPVTLESKVRSVRKILSARQVHLVCDELAFDCLRTGAARELTEQEVSLWNLAHGGGQ